MSSTVRGNPEATTSPQVTSPQVTSPEVLTTQTVRIEHRGRIQLSARARR